jgi:hypothetical protein
MPGWRDFYRSKDAQSSTWHKYRQCARELDKLGGNEAIVWALCHLTDAVNDLRVFLEDLKNEPEQERPGVDPNE